MQIFVKSNVLVSLAVSGDETVASLRQKLAQSGCEASDVNFAKDGHVLNDESTLCDAGVCDLTTLDMVAALPGGKVHGSLARAGKVKGQTPKVEAQEKKKKKTGRASRRQQYNRRFVNVVQTFGRKKGPNSNS